MDWLGIIIGAIVFACLLWALIRPAKVTVIEPKRDPDSPYTPGGAAIMRGLREADTERQRQLDAMLEWR